MIFHVLNYNGYLTSLNQLFSFMQDQTVNMYGLLRATVNDELKIQKLEVFYDPTTFLRVLEGSEEKEACSQARSLIGDISTLATEKLS